MDLRGKKAWRAHDYQRCAATDGDRNRIGHESALKYINRAKSSLTVAARIVERAGGRLLRSSDLASALLWVAAIIVGCPVN